MEKAYYPILNYAANKIKTVSCFQRDRHTDQWNNTENLVTDPYKYAQLNFERGTKVIQGRKAGFPTNGAAIIGHQ